MPSPKWKLVVDIGEPEPIIPGNTSISVSNNVEAHSHAENSGINLDHPEATESDGRDSRIDQVISLLGEYMPSDPSSPLASYLPGFMSLRLMLLRLSRTPDEDEMVRTLMGSFSSYSSGGRAKNDIAIMLARDYMFLAQQHQSQPHSFQQQHAQSFLVQSSSPSMMHANAPGPSYSFYGIGPQAPGPPASFQNSPALAPIPMSGNPGDSVSIVSA